MIPKPIESKSEPGVVIDEEVNIIAKEGLGR